MERDFFVGASLSPRQNFNSHAHVERDLALPVLTADNSISTHTLTWSVTCCNVTAFDVLYFNSHAHVERDLVDNVVYYNHRHFNSHAHVERDIDEHRLSSILWISTHTLTWSVTRSCYRQTESKAFQLTRSRGA